MIRMPVFLIVCVLPLLSFCVNEVDGRDDVIVGLNSLRAFLQRAGSSDLTLSQLSEVLNGIRKQRNRVTGNNRQNGLDLQRQLADIRAFCESKAYSLTSREERLELSRLIAWLESIKDGQLEKMATPPEFVKRIVEASGAEHGHMVLPTWAFELPNDLKTGDVILRRQLGYLSEHFVKLSTREARFTHAGIVVISNCVPIITSVCVDDISASGEVCLQSWTDYSYGSLEQAVYRYSGPDAEKVRERIARAAEKRIGTPFDPAFDLKTKDRLYCTEMVRDCVNEAAGREVIGTSRKGDFEYVAVDDCYRNEMTKVWDCRDQKPEEKQQIQKLQSRPVVIESSSTTNAPVRRTIRFIPKNR